MTGTAPEPRAGMEALKSFFRGWEKLRLSYNLILAGILLVSHLPVMKGEFFTPMALLIWLVGAAIANLCFLAGPLAEAYLYWLGIRSRFVKPLLFLGGVLVSVPLVWWFMPLVPLARWRLGGS